MKLVVLVALVMFTQFVYSQKESPTGKTWGLTSLYNLGKTGYDAARKGEVILDSTVMPVMIVDLKGNFINTSGFSEMYPNNHIPIETLKVKYSEMSNIVDTVAVLWFLRESRHSKFGIINIMLIGVTSDNVYHFYFDNNNNHDFSDDEASFIFTPDVKTKSIVVEDEKTIYQYSIKNPFLKEEDKYTLRLINDSEWVNASRRFNVSINFSILSGSGRPWMSFSPINESDTILIEYKAHLYASMQFNLALELSYYNFSILLSGNLEKEDFGERYKYVYIKITEDDIRTRIIPTIGQWPDYKFHYEIIAAYNIRLFYLFRVSPYAAISSWLYLNDDPFLRYKKTSVDKNFINRYSYSLGTKLKYILGERAAIFFDFRFQKSFFDASSYFEYADPSSFKMKYEKFYFCIGMKYRL